MLALEKLLGSPDSLWEVASPRLRFGEFQEQGTLPRARSESLPELDCRLFILALLGRSTGLLAQHVASNVLAGGDFRFLGGGEGC